MKVFISSLISGMEAERAAVKRAVERLGHAPIMAEDFGARPSSPQVACLGGVRESDLVILILGPRYGVPQAGGVSATHEEILEARNRKPILVFLQAGAEPEDSQVALINEVGGWEGGLFRQEFASPEDLEDKVTRAIHRHELAHAVAPLNPEELKARATRLLPALERGYGANTLQLAIASGPVSAILRPAEVEAPSLIAEIQQSALFGSHPIFDRAAGSRSRLEGEALVVDQDDGHRSGASVRLWPNGDLLISVPVPPPGRGMGLPVVLEEDVAGKLASAVGYAAWLLSRIDPTERITHIVPAVRLSGDGGGAWRTRAEHDASPNSGQFPWRQGEHEEPVFLAPAHQVRQVLSMDARRVIEDFVVLLRRRWNQD
ncbi:TPA: DUF4062 domain-containing protein [Stenotrophomonas maltophilia]|nr:DUF4062 domain-containing protein [Stenotrophomonas maltophilia]